MPFKRSRQDHVCLEIVPDATMPKTGKSIRVTTPADMVDIDSKEELAAQLEHYHQPLIRNVVPDAPAARKRYVEWLRPALRYYCAKFGMKVPDWLANDSYYLELPPEEKIDLFGTTDLKIRKFEPIVHGSGSASVHGAAH